MNRLALTLILLLVSACNTKLSESDVQHLNGYWEIQEVIFSDGLKKTYTVNTTIDYIQIDSLKGFRKKVKPKFNGTYETSDDAEPFLISMTKDSVRIFYLDDLAKRSETLQTISKSSFSVTNQEGITYIYKRYEPINVSK